MLHLPSNFSISNCVTPPRAPFSSPSRYMSPSHHLSSPHRRGFTPADAAREAIPGSPSRFIFNNMPQQPLSSHKKKKNKPPKKPKGYVSGFNFFASEARTRDDLKEEFRDLSNIDIHKAVGRMWHELPQQDKAAYLQLADEDKLRYLREVHEYNQLYGENLVPKVDPPSGFGLDGQPLSADFEHHFVNDDDLTKNEKSKKKRGRRVNPAKKGYLKNVTGLKRPLTSYSLFAHQEKDLLCGMKFQDLQRRMGKYLGLRWRNMDPEERRMYDLLAETGATTTDKQWLSA